MSLRTQRTGTPLPCRKTSALKRQARRERFRRSEEETESRPNPPGASSARGFELCVKVAEVSGAREAFIRNQSVKALREDCGTSAKRIPTRPLESCHITSPESLISVTRPGRLN